MQLLRHTKTENSFIGDLTDNDAFICKILELPWKNNTPTLSCIPEGVFVYKRVPVPFHLKWMEAKGYKTLFEAQNVPGRSGVFIHIGNGPKNTLGCQLTGIDQEVDFVSQSELAMANFMMYVKDLDEFQLEIVGGY